MKSFYLKSILLLTSGSMLGQIIGFIGSMIMTRMYTASEIGIMTTIVSISGIFAPVINARFDFALVKEQKERYILALVKMSIYIGIALSLIVSLVSYIYFIGIEGFISPFISILFVFLILVIQAFSNVFKSYNNNIGDFKTMTSVIVMRRFAEEISMAIFGLLGWKAIGLLISRVIGQYFGMKREIKNIKKKYKEIISVRWQDMTEAYNIHKRQLYYSAPAALMNAGSYSLISLVVGKYFGLEILGVYAISFAVLGLPLSVISGNVSKVYFSEASKEYAIKGTFNESTNKTLVFLIIVAIVLFFIMYYIFPMIVPFIYGSKYEMSGFMIRILAPMFAVRFVSSAINTGLVVCNKQNFELIIQIMFMLSVAMLAFLCNYKILTISTFLLGVSISYSIVYLINLLSIYYFSKSK
mgnify:FL=1